MERVMARIPIVAAVILLVGCSNTASDRHADRAAGHESGDPRPEYQPGDAYRQSGVVGSCGEELFCPYTYRIEDHYF
jgi:hypothetical protein